MSGKIEFLFLAFAILVFANSAAARSAQIAAGETIVIDGVKARAGMIAGRMTLIDVRSQAEWRQTSVPTGAKTVTIHNPEEMPGFVTALTQAVKGRKNEPIALICARGGRSSSAERALRAAGFSNISNVREGMLGNPVDGPG